MRALMVDQFLYVLNDIEEYYTNAEYNIKEQDNSSEIE